ncbi:MAG: mitochondrial fission ELM1 family protein [Alphaproteobacteria bacterium]
MLQRPPPAIRSSWIVSDGKVGMETQCLGLAEALGLAPEVKRIVVGKPWRWLQPTLTLNALGSLRAKGDRLQPPWPDLIIATGRHSVAPVLAVKRRAGPDLRLVQIQNPGVRLDAFDLVITPAHDQVEGPNVLSTMGSMHRVSQARLDEAKARFEAHYAALPRPLVAVLVGGANKAFTFGADTAAALGAGLARMAHQSGAGLAVTASRRTGGEAVAALRDALADAPAALWDGSGDNPYFGLLALADAIVVTCDSVNMVSEALATGKPVHVADLPGGSPKFARFHEALRSHGLTRPFAGRLEHWTYDPPDDMRRAVAAVTALFDRQRTGTAGRCDDNAARRAG